MIGKPRGEDFCVMPGSRGDNESVESFNGKMRNGILEREVFYVLKNG